MIFKRIQEVHLPLNLGSNLQHSVAVVLPDVRGEIGRLCSLPRHQIDVFHRHTSLHAPLHLDDEESNSIPQNGEELLHGVEANLLARATPTPRTAQCAGRHMIAERSEEAEGGVLRVAERQGWTP